MLARGVQYSLIQLVNWRVISKRGLVVAVIFAANSVALHPVQIGQPTRVYQSRVFSTVGVELGAGPRLQLQPVTSEVPREVPRSLPVS